MVTSIRMSDIFGRKEALLVAVTFFTVWSLACGVAQSIQQLYAISPPSKIKMNI
jgi:MFS family permease